MAFSWFVFPVGPSDPAHLHLKQLVNRNPHHRDNEKKPREPVYFLSRAHMPQTSHRTLRVRDAPTREYSFLSRSTSVRVTRPSSLPSSDTTGSRPAPSLSMTRSRSSSGVAPETVTTSRRIHAFTCCCALPAWGRSGGGGEWRTWGSREGGSARLGRLDDRVVFEVALEVALGVHHRRRLLVDAQHHLARLLHRVIRPHRVHSLCTRGHSWARGERAGKGAG